MLLLESQVAKGQVDKYIAHEAGQHARHTECISPYVNPGHVLAAPRHWLEAVVKGEYTWQFFRLRYKHLLRSRFQENPEPFFALLEASDGENELVLTCHCLAGPCHAEVAVDFLERLRDQAAYQQWAALRHRLALFPLPFEHPALSARQAH